jgi:hypothetical protein
MTDRIMRGREFEKRQKRATQAGARMKRKRGLMTVAMLAGMLAAGCAHYVTVEYPPVVELRNIEMVGVVKFAILKGDPSLSDDVTHRFIASVQRAQPGTRLLDLGTEEEVLSKVGARQLDPEAIQAIGRICGVDAVLSGSVTFKSPQPQVSVARLTRVNASVKVDASMQAVLRETGRGATLWTNGASGTWTLGGVTVANGTVGGRMSDPAQKHEQIIAELVRVTSNDFRPTWERRRAPE